jgi:hypothetical protein
VAAEVTEGKICLIRFWVFREGAKFKVIQSNSRLKIKNPGEKPAEKARNSGLFPLPKTGVFVSKSGIQGVNRSYWE